MKYPGGAYQTGVIESVSFVPLPTPPSVRIQISARVGKAAIPDKIMRGVNRGLSSSSRRTGHFLSANEIGRSFQPVRGISSQEDHFVCCH